jgi:preprotein translocase subunit SecE
VAAASPKLSPLRFLREVRAEAGRVTWPSRRETLVTTGLVVAMAVLTAIFFFLVDQVIGFAVRALFGTPA